MSYRYKSALVSLISLALGYGWYFGLLLARHGRMQAPLAHLVFVVVIVVVLQIVGHILIAIFSAEKRAQPLDERERGFDRRATGIGYQVLVVGALCACATIHLGFDRADMANAIVLAVVVAECARQAKFLKLHHSAA